MVGIDNEVWKEVPGFGGKYLASNLGRIKAPGSMYNARYTGRLFARKERVFKMKHISKHGYKQALLNGKTYPAHRVIAMTFIPNPENKRCVNHKNGIKTDNRVENLEWATHSENSKHASRMGLLHEAHGEENHFAKLKSLDVLEIRKKFIPRKYSSRRIAKEYGISKTNVLDIVNKRIWKHI